MMRVILVAVMFALVLAQDAPAQPCPELPFHLLVPFNYPCIVHPRVGRTDYGQCRLGVGVRPGTLCQCWANNGYWYPGVCIC
jgi:hypothetical protein